MLVAFISTQTRVRTPLLPLRVVLDRRRGGSYLAVFSLAIGMFAALFFLTFYLQNIRHYSPVRAGVSFLPLTVGLMAGVRAVSPLLAKAPVRALICPGLLTIAAGLALLGLLRADSSYWFHVLPVFLLVGLGTGWVLVTANSTATLGAGPDSAVAGAMVMTSQQVGASLGTALLSTVAGTVAAHSGAVHGFNVASLGAAGFLCVAALAVYWVLSERSPDHQVEGAFAIGTPVGVRAEEVPLALDQRRRQPLGPQPVVVRQRGGEAGGRDADCAAPATTRRQASCAVVIASVKYGASSSERQVRARAS